MAKSDYIKELPLSTVEDLLRTTQCSIYVIPHGYAPILVRNEDYYSPAPCPEGTSPVVYQINPTGTEPHIHEIKIDRFLNNGLTATPPTQIPQSNDTSVKSKTKVPRPRNAFIIYRTLKHNDVVKKGITNTNASRVIADMWKNEPDSVREHFQRLALEESIQHKLLYPEYRYTPRRPGEKQRRRKRKNILSTFASPETMHEPLSPKSITSESDSTPSKATTYPDDLFSTDLGSLYFGL
ncbi:uncharacterized protein V1510DRAFT_384263 [Dipodascopsis tothii]|uniref:uncharacterized protein n=1 Tax=Dipodascopsis tothii TaxID=44089 RepID=UPI0034CD9E76